MISRIAFIAVLLALLLVGCIVKTDFDVLSNKDFSKTGTGKSVQDSNLEKDIELPLVSPELKELAGTWRILSMNVFYADGRHGTYYSTGVDGNSEPGVLPFKDKENSLNTFLELKEDGSWQFSSWHGTWEVKNMEEKDFEKWQVPQGFASKKIVLNGWKNSLNSSGAGGPIQEGPLIWLMYGVNPSAVRTDGNIQLKFFKTNYEFT